MSEEPVELKVLLEGLDSQPGKVSWELWLSACSALDFQSLCLSSTRQKLFFLFPSWPEYFYHIRENAAFLYASS